MGAFDRDRRLEAARAYVLSNIDRPISLLNVARSAGVSANYFSRLFHKSVGTRFSDWVSLQRVHKAQQLILERETSITEIAYASGFGSVSSLERAFKKHAGCTPSAFRSIAREKARYADYS